MTKKDFNTTLNYILNEFKNDWIKTINQNDYSETILILNYYKNFRNINIEHLQYQKGHQHPLHLAVIMQSWNCVAALNDLEYFYDLEARKLELGDLLVSQMMFLNAPDYIVKQELEILNLLYTIKIKSNQY